MVVCQNVLARTLDAETQKLDMNHYKKITFDSLIADISCTKLSNTVFDFCTNMVQYRDFLYFMGSTRAGRNVYIYSKSGKFIKEITFSDALIVKKTVERKEGIVFTPDSTKIVPSSR
jgi:hypothetical protein